MSKHGAHVGEVLLLPTRAFALGSGGAWRCTAVYTVVSLCPLSVTAPPAAAMPPCLRCALRRRLPRSRGCPAILKASESNRKGSEMQ